MPPVSPLYGGFDAFHEEEALEAETGSTRGTCHMLQSYISFTYFTYDMLNCTCNMLNITFYLLHVTFFMSHVTVSY